MRSILVKAVEIEVKRYIDLARGKYKKWACRPVLSDDDREDHLNDIRNGMEFLNTAVLLIFHDKTVEELRQEDRRF